MPATIALFTASLGTSACERGAPAVPAGLFASTATRQAGAALFAQNCAICHGAAADGNGKRREGMNPPPANLTLPPWSDQASAPRTFLVIRNGVPGTAMPSWSVLSNQEIWQVVAFLIAQRAN